MKETSFWYFIKQGRISGSISHGVGPEEIKGYIDDPEKINGPIQPFKDISFFDPAAGLPFCLSPVP
jgi:hypothetical protein